jgi:hypothetical protein
MVVQFFESLAQLEPVNLCIAWIIFIIGSPIMMLNNILMFILDLIMPEGWNNE